MKKLLIIILILLTCFCLVSCADTSVSENTSDLSNSEKEGAASDKYNALLKAWAGGAEVYHDGNIVYPDTYGGSYLNEDKCLVICTTSLGKKTLKEYEEILGDTDIIYKKVKYSYNELLDEQKRIMAKVTEGGNKYYDQIDACGIDEVDNAITLYILPQSNDKSENEKLSEQIARKVTNFKNVNVTGSLGAVPA